MVSRKKTGISLVFCLMWAISLCVTLSANAASLTHHQIDISFDLPNHKILGTVDATVPSTVRKIVVGRDLRITRFEMNGKTTAVRLKEGRIHLPRHGDRTRVLIEYEGIFPNEGQGISDKMIGEEGVFLLTGWYPAAEADLSYFSLRATIPKSLHAVSEADYITSRDMGEEKLVIFDFPHPVTNIHFIMSEYVVNKDRYGNVELETYLLPEDKNLAARYLDFTKKYLEMYVDMLGPYPFRRFAVVENVLPTGYGMPTFTLLGRQVLKLPFIPETSLGHEVLHSWFGNSVYVDYEKGNWSEGLTAYLADHYYEELQKNGWQYRKKTIENYESYIHEDNEISIRQFTSGGNRALRAVGYGKTAMLFHMLNKRVSDDSFKKALKQLIEKQSFRLTSWHDIEEVFSETAGEDLGGFFEFWQDEKGGMEIDLKKVRLSRPDEKYNLEFTIKVMNGPATVSIPIVIRAEDKEERKILSVSKAKETVTLALEGRPLEIIVDPDYDLFRSLTPSEARPVLSRLMGDPTRTVVLPETNQGIYESLIKELQNRGFQTALAKDVNHSDLGNKAFIFLGSQSDLKSFFTEVAETPEGFSLQIRKNPIRPKLVLGLVIARDSGEVSGVGPRLFHYGQYSTLRFSRGKNVEKQTEKSDRGIKHEVASPATGIALENVLPLPKIVSRLADKKIVYVGEKHDRYGDHLIQLEVIRELHKKYPKLAIGMEMFQRRYQNALDDFVFGRTDTETFLRKSHYFSTWRFNYHLYEDILEYARAHNIPVVALNQDHELVSKVAREGLEQLSRKEKGRIPEEMIFEDEPYKKRLRRVFEMHQTEPTGDRTPQVFEYFHQAQVLWDETMAESIATFLADHPDYHMVVLAGSGHLAYGSGIPKRAYRRTGEEYAIILPDPGEPPEPGVADFIVFPSEVEAPKAAKLGVMIDSSEGKLKISDFVGGNGAQEAGMKKGDIIWAVGGHKVESIDDLKSYLATKYVGDRVQVKVLRDKKKTDLEVELGAPIQHGR